jgi:hypothetical protein
VIIVNSNNGKSSNSSSRNSVRVIIATVVVSSGNNERCYVSITKSGSGGDVNTYEYVQSIHNIYKHFMHMLDLTVSQW